MYRGTCGGSIIVSSSSSAHDGGSRSRFAVEVRDELMRRSRCVPRLNFKFVHAARLRCGTNETLEVRSSRLRCVDVRSFVRSFAIDRAFTPRYLKYQASSK